MTDTEVTVTDGNGSEAVYRTDNHGWISGLPIETLRSGFTASYSPDDQNVYRMYYLVEDYEYFTVHFFKAHIPLLIILALTALGIVIVYFLRENDSLLRLTRPRFDGGVLWRTCANGSSELMSNISGSIVAMLYNFQLLRLAGEDGVAAYGAIMYVNFIFLAIFIGYAIGSAPVISYHYGAGHSEELHSLLVKSAVLNEGVGMAMMVLAFLASGPLAKIFVGYDRDLYELTVQGFHLYAVSYLLCGFNIFGSSFFTALNNGLASALISFLRTMVFQCAAVLILPVFLEVDGIWLAVAVAETLTLLVTLVLLAKYRKTYRY